MAVSFVFCKLLNNQKPESYYLHTDRLGSGSVVTDGSCEAVHILGYMPYGETLLDLSHTHYETPYQFTGYEKDQETGLHYAEARYYESRLSIFNSTDPLWWKSPDKMSYHYCSNNPIMRVDPNGRDDYKLDKKTGEVAKVATTADGYDRILKSNRKGEIITNKYGSSEVAIDNIPKGILKDNMNLKNEAHLISIGTDNAPTLPQMEEFMYNLSDYLSKEILGVYYSEENRSDAPITAVYLDGYKDNTYKSGTLKKIDSKIVPKGLFSNTFVHTHILIDDGNHLPHEPSEYDMNAKKEISNKVKNFLIITREYSKPHNLKRIRY